MRAAFLAVVTAAHYAETSFSNYGNATLSNISDFGCRRGVHEPYTSIGQELNLDEQAKLACEYAALVGSKYRAPSGSVSSLVYEWDIYCTDTCQRIYYKFKYGQTIFSQRGRSVQDKIMDVLSNHDAVVHIIKDAKGRVSGRRPQAAF